jgi:hypothetical protein
MPGQYSRILFIFRFKEGGPSLCRGKPGEEKACGTAVPRRGRPACGASAGQRGENRTAYVQSGRSACIEAG